jgi:hypothetical protein
MYERWVMLKPSKYQRASQLEEIGYLTKEMMYNKYDDMKSLTKKNKQRLNYFSAKAVEHPMQNGKDNAMLAKNGTPLPRRLFKNKKRWLEK